MSTYRLQFSRLGWRGQIVLVLATALGLAAAVALVIVSLGLALVLLPVVAIALFVARFRLNRRLAAMQAAWTERERQESGRVIETDYAVVEDDEDPRRR